MNSKIKSQLEGLVQKCTIFLTITKIKKPTLHPYHPSLCEQCKTTKCGYHGIPLSTLNQWINQDQEEMRKQEQIRQEEKLREHIVSNTHGDYFSGKRKRHPIRQLMLKERNNLYDSLYDANWDACYGDSCEAYQLGVCMEGENHEFDINDVKCRECGCFNQEHLQSREAYPRLTLLS